MSVLLTVLLLGVSYGMILYIISVGLSITMGLMRFINLAHGAFAMMGGYATVTLMGNWGVSFFPAVAAAFVWTAALGVLLERTLYVRLYGAADFEQILFSIALVFIAIAASRYSWGPLPQPIRIPDYLRGQITLAGLQFPAYRLMLIIVGFTAVAGLHALLEHSTLGAQVRAAVDNRRMSESLGVNSSLLFTLMFALGSGLAGLGGGLGAELLPIYPGYALKYVIMCAIVVALGGAGTVRGPFFAALIIGVSDTMFRYYVPGLGSLFIYGLIIVVLLFRPHGLVPQMKG